VRAERDHLVAKQKLADAYGKIPMRAYEHRKAILDGNEVLSHETLRQDYEFGVDSSGLFEMRFSCYCTKCGLDFSFEHSEQIDLTIPDDVV
jgi:hypothetical protein